MTRIECPSCNQKYSVEESLLGFEVQCSACNTIFIAQKKAPIKLQLPNEFKSQTTNDYSKEKTTDSPIKELSSTQTSSEVQHNANRAEQSIINEKIIDSNTISKTNLSNETGTLVLSNSSTPKTANAWRRFGARFIDMSIEVHIISFILIYILFLYVDFENNNTLYKVVNWLVNCLISPILSLWVDSIVYGIFKGTLGKWLFGVNVVEENQQKPSHFRYFIRNMNVLYAGIGFNLPIVALCTLFFQYNRVSKGKRTTYDQKMRFNSVVNNNSLSKTTMGIVLVTIFIVSRIIFEVSNLK